MAFGLKDCKKVKLTHLQLGKATLTGVYFYIVVQYIL